MSSNVYCDSWPSSVIKFSIIILFIMNLFLISTVNSVKLPCLPCDAKMQNTLEESHKDPPYEEFVFEHQITKQEAINALSLLNETFFSEDYVSEEVGCHTMKCDKKVQKYCHSALFLNDHCWCEQGHKEEGLPYVPHTCYVGEKEYHPSIGSCFEFWHVKKCCCLRVLAKKWRHLSAAPILWDSGTFARTQLWTILIIAVTNFITQL